jgi:hypothetical protein
MSLPNIFHNVCIKCSKGVLPFLKRKHLINNSTYSVLLLVQQVTVPLENYNHHLHYSNFDLWHCKFFYRLNFCFRISALVFQIIPSSLPLHYGVPQGPVVAPASFLKYLFVPSCDFKLILFADDTFSKYIPWWFTDTE